MNLKIYKVYITKKDVLKESTNFFGLILVLTVFFPSIWSISCVIYHIRSISYVIYRQYHILTISQTMYFSKVIQTRITSLIYRDQWWISRFYFRSKVEMLTYKKVLSITFFTSNGRRFLY